MQRKWLALTLATSLTAFSALSHAEDPMSGKNPMPPGHPKADMFDMMDSNHDGNVTKAEFDAMHNQHFAEMDKNNDGSVTQQEMQAFQTSMHSKHKQMTHDMKDHPTMSTPDEKSSSMPKAGDEE